ncbi:MAG: hypothetical protein GY854_07850 [Deltaproteobacteria bacterium]|nr:hypothetical protein [Deltaproteobacteria bacterium]
MARIAASLPLNSSDVLRLQDQDMVEGRMQRWPLETELAVEKDERER